MSYIPNSDSQGIEQIESFANRLKQIRQEKGMTLEEFSKLVDIPAQSINRYELGQRMPKLDTVTKISKKLSLNPLWIQGYDTEKTEYDALTKSVFGLNGNRETETEMFEKMGLLPPSKTGMYVIPKIGENEKNVYVNKKQLDKIKEILKVTMPEIFEQDN